MSQIIIKKPYIEKKDNTSYLHSKFLINHEEKDIFFSVDSRYEKYLVDDRADSFIVSILTYAMKNNLDIVSEAPISKELLYSIVNYFIPMTSSNMEKFNKIKIIANPTNKKIISEGAVCTGFTGGVDSMYTLMTHLNRHEKNFNLTHLLVFNNGALEKNGNEKTLKELVERLKSGIAKECNLEVLGINTNIQEIVDEHFLSVVTIRHIACVLSMQKLFGIFLNSATYPFRNFSFDQDNMGYYELMVVNLLRTECTITYSTGGEKARIEKIKSFENFPLAHKYLRPCIHNSNNCNICGKCVRTMVAIYALGELDKYSKVFDVDYFYKNIDWYIGYTIAHSKNEHYRESLIMMLKKGIPISDKAKKIGKTLIAAQKIADKNKKILKNKILH